ncbi:hypothetical protein ABW20_dc0110008 [Dactylellina cionopaga]|nr:hypothetical protein ABW20_dc0110008 [Dactylellina cionopaga]
MAKDRTLHPATAHLKAEKSKAQAKSQKLRLQQRQERLAHRNPERIQRQIDEMRQKEEKGLTLTPYEKKTVEELEKEVKAVRKAREVAGVLPSETDKERGQRSDRGRGRGDSGFRGRGRGGGRGGDQGRQRFDNRGGDDGNDSDASTASSVLNIPLPTGPPPIPQLQIGRKDADPLPAHLTGLPSKPGAARVDAARASQPVVTTYSSAPVMRDLKKEAAVFMPAVVQKQKKVADAIEKIKRDAEDMSIEDDN